MPRPVHFEIHASDPEPVREFYEQLFGWEFEKWGDQDYWLITTGEDGEPGVNGGMLPRQGPRPDVDAPVSAWVMSVDVPDCQGYLDKAIALGADQALPVMDMSGVGKVAYFKDPDGNIVGLYEDVRSAG